MDIIKLDTFETLISLRVRDKVFLKTIDEGSDLFPVAEARGY